MSQVLILNPELGHGLFGKCFRCEGENGGDVIDFLDLVVRDEETATQVVAMFAHLNITTTMFDAGPWRWIVRIRACREHVNQLEKLAHLIRENGMTISFELMTKAFAWEDQAHTV